MPTRSLRTRQDCEDFVTGCLFYGTGGGGDPDRGLLFLDDALAEGLVPGWVDLEDVPDDVQSCTAYGMGSIAPMTEQTEKEIARLELVDRLSYRALEVSIRELARFAGVDIGVLVPAELGPSNTPAPLVAAARMGLRVIDGDYAGRAIPEEMQTTHYLAGKQSWPFASVDRWGDVVLVKEVCNAMMMERIGKMLSVAAFRGCAIAATLLGAAEMKRIVVPGTLTRCLALGQEIRKSLGEGSDPVGAILRSTGGWRLFEGVVADKTWENRDGYMIGSTRIAGSGPFNGHTLRVWFKNENHVAWLDDQPFVTSPDLISIVEPSTGRGITNTVIAVGTPVAVLGVRGLEAFRTRDGLECAGPRHFGFDLDYRPIEEVVSGASVTTSSGQRGR